MKKRIKKGFTLVELLVVIAILAILSTVAVVGYSSFTQKAKESNANTEMKQVQNVINYELMTGNYEFKDGETTYVIHADSFELYSLEDGKETAVDTGWEGVDLKKFFPDLADLNGTLSVSELDNDKKVITYTKTEDNVQATWTYGSDEIVVGSLN